MARRRGKAVSEPTLEELEARKAELEQTLAQAAEQDDDAAYNEVLGELEGVEDHIKALTPDTVPQPVADPEFTDEEEDERAAAFNDPEGEELTDDDPIAPKDGNPGAPLVVEEPSGQTALDTGDEPILTTTVIGPRPTKAKIKVKAFEEEVTEDHQPGEERLYVVSARVRQIDGIGSDTRVHVAEAAQFVHIDESLAGDATEAVEAVRHAQTRGTRDRAVIDHMCRWLEQIYETEAPESYEEIIDELRERGYREYNVPDDPYIAGHGIPEEEQTIDDFDFDALEDDDGIEEDDVVDAEVTEPPDTDLEWNEPEAA